MSTTPADDASTVEVAAFIDAQPISAFQVKLLLACATVLFLDGFDTTAIGYVAPALAKEWNLGKGALGPVFSAGLFGLMIGALLLGPLADRIGRKKIIILSTLAFGIGTLVTFLVNDVSALLAIRFLTGLGLGGAMPNTVALTSEFSPHRRRATMVMAMFVGFSIGAALGGLLAAALIPAFGWRAVFVVGGAAPLMLVPVLMWRLPESVRYLALTGQADATVAKMLGWVNSKVVFAPGTRFVVNEPDLKGIPVQHLFTGGRTLATLLLWVVFFMSLLDLYFLSNWLPTVLNDLGASISTAAVIGSMFQLGGVVGTFVLGRVIDRFSFRALALVYFIAVFAVGAIGQLGHSSVLVTIAIFSAGFCIVGGQIAANALAAAFYPTSVRATGVGWALGMGRVGSIVGPSVGGILLSLQWSAGELFMTAAVAALCASLAAFWLARMARPGERTGNACDRPRLEAMTRAQA
ncbi:MAG TPA: MFS transporter [Bradyrhizobium sp.]|uniref:MFS transporter n=1 Tax=Bradyrhizobium sp. TaxID=376 RepID=UPI002D8006D9|nr:MFS transporter [Bradyrhizobium sp.]HET7884636.1 MFS transporter [Bradyrhizobium sp.]